jgi:hypothetical protein
VAVRFDADTEEYTRASSLGTITQFSITCWLKISVDQNNISTVWCVDNGFAGDYIRLCTDTDGTTLIVEDDVDVHTLGAATVGTWHYVGFSVNGVSATAVMQAANASAPTVTTWVDSSSSTNIVNLRIGDAVFDGQYLNGCIAAFKFWSGVTLTQAELETEAWTYLPRRATGLRGWYPFLRAETTDYSGLGQTLSGGTGTTTEDGPPVPWRSRRIAAFIPPATAVTGSIAATLPPLGATAAATVTVDGQAPATLPALAAAATSTATATGQATPTLPTLQAALAGATTTPGLLAATLPPLVASFAGDLTGGFLTPVLPALDASAQGTASTPASLAAELPALTASLAGAAEIPLNNFTYIAGPLRRGWTSSALTQAWTSSPGEPVWTARDPSRAWGDAAPARGWSSRPPTK